MNIYEYVGTRALPRLRGNDCWYVMRNVNGMEVETGRSAKRETTICDVKGLSQLYQHQIGGDFFRMQANTTLTNTT